MLRCSESFWLSFFDNVTIGTINFVSFILKLILLELASSLLTLVAKTQCFVNLSFNSPLQIINSISSELQKLLRHFNDYDFVAFFRIPFAAAGFPINLVLNLKDLKLVAP